MTESPLQAPAVAADTVRAFNRQIAGSLQPTLGVRKQLLESLQPTLGVPKQLIESIQPTLGVRKQLLESLQPTLGVPKQFLESLQPMFESQRQIARTIVETLNTRGFLDQSADVASWIRKVVEGFQSAIPPNLNRLEIIEEAVSLTHDEGLPLVWVPRQEIVKILIEAPDAASRRQILMDNLGLILDDCMAVLDDCSLVLDACTPDVAAAALECANQSKDAVRALNAELHGPAQSHAANVIDSLLPHISAFLGDEPKRIAAIACAKEDIDDEWTLAALIHRLALRPLARAYAEWYPNSGRPTPDHFDRHVTAHAVGHPNVFNRHNALIAVMLATSLTRQMCHVAARYLPDTNVAA